LSPPILTYHKICKFDVGGTWVTPLQFESHIKFLKKKGINLCTISDALKGKGTGLSFDDGYENFYTYGKDILLKYGYRATIFVIAGFIGKENNWDVNFGVKFKHLNRKQIKELADLGFEIGSHTLTHRDLTKLPENEIKKELKESKKILEDITGKEVKYLSYPFGRYNERIEEILCEEGYERGFSINPFKNGDITIGRVGVYLIDFNDFLFYKLGADGISFLEKVKSSVINYFSNLSAFYKFMLKKRKG